MSGAEDLAKAAWSQDGQEAHEFNGATVVSVNADGTVNLNYLGESHTNIEALHSYMERSIGDIVMVRSNGDHWTVVGKIGDAFKVIFPDPPIIPDPPIMPPSITWGSTDPSPLTGWHVVSSSWANDDGRIYHRVGAATPGDVRSSNKYSSGTGSDTSSTVPLPSGWQPGDLCYLCYVTRGTSVNTTNPSGWSDAVAEFGMSGTSGNSTIGVMRRVLQAGDSNPVISHTSSRFSAITVAVTAGSFDPTTTSDVTPTTDTQAAGVITTVSAPSITPVNDQCLLLTFHATSNNVVGIAITYSPPAGMAELQDTVSGSSASGNTALEACSLQLGTSSGGVSTGVKTATVTGSDLSNVSRAAVTIAVRPKSAGTGPPPPVQPPPPTQPPPPVGTTTYLPTSSKAYKGTDAIIGYWLDQPSGTTKRPQGYNTGYSGLATGIWATAWFYGPNIEDKIQAKKPSKVEVRVIRSSETHGSSGAVPLRFYLHIHETPPSDELILTEGPYTGPALKRGQEGWFQLPQAGIDYIYSGNSRGFAISSADDDDFLLTAAGTGEVRITA